ncbi:MAG: hypothetical protein JW822_03915 [Spirochaetales bacterium]|nr:hypothetical protein [Spirochaetales bacterium]
MFFKNSTLRYITLLGALIVLLSACSDFKIEKPDGFARVEMSYYDAHDILYKAVSPEGILFKVKKVENYPPMELDFWAKALSNQLQKEGYTLIGEEQRFETDKREGVYFKWGLPYGNASYIYLTAVIVCDNEILIIEVAGEQSIFKDYEDTIILSMQSISYK